MHGTIEAKIAPAPRDPPPEMGGRRSSGWAGLRPLPLLAQEGTCAVLLKWISAFRIITQKPNSYEIGLHRKITGGGMMNDNRIGALLGHQLILFRNLDADADRIEEGK